MDELRAALEARDWRSARRLTQESVGTPAFDDALAVLASEARTEGSAAELLIEALDSSGVMRRFAGAALLDSTAVDDVAQEALISVAYSIESYDGRGKVTTWVHSIVRRRVVDHLRRQRQDAPLDEDAGPAARISSMIATRTTVREALEALPELYRQPVVHRDIEGLSYKEIAQRLGRAEGTVKAQISRGRAMVAAQLKEGLTDE
ncbi:RNA polymerase sigma factor [Nesterenkonia pannonica]|uniref:RNA polymerase sigma factor n=1 Tax=Nesterenkonia pannonica TaxID=1548602 RepID=UPI002164BD3B|nr:RNA polymerase sigma factor [Nesterenkonia pannonica]